MDEDVSTELRVGVLGDKSLVTAMHNFLHLLFHEEQQQQQQLVTLASDNHLIHKLMMDYLMWQQQLLPHELLNMPMMTIESQIGDQQLFLMQY